MQSLLIACLIGFAIGQSYSTLSGNDSTESVPQLQCEELEGEGTEGLDLSWRVHWVSCVNDNLQASSYREALLLIRSETQQSIEASASPHRGPPQI